MSTGYRLADYFVIIGLDRTCGLEPDQLSGDSLHCPPLDRPYKSRTLNHYPESVPWNSFDGEAACMLCQPRGLSFQTQRDKRDTGFHSFIITKEDGARTFGAAFTFFEEVEQEDICVAMQTLQAMHMAELSNVQSRTLYSHLGQPHSRSPKHGYKPDARTVGHTYDMTKDKLFVTKTICLISHLPLIATFEKILRALHDTILSKVDPQLPLECYIYNIIFEVPLPPPGRSIKLTTVNSNTICQRPSVTELPLLDYALRDIFKWLGIENVLNVFSSMLLERQILLYSQDYQRLMTVAEGITALVFPFQWQHVYVPILPASLLHFLDAPVPFIMGLHHSTDGQALMQHCAKANMCFVDIDSGSVELPEDLPLFPYRQDLREDLMLHLNSQTDREHLAHWNGHQRDRDSGFRESWAGVDSGLSSEATSASSSTWSLASKMELLQQSEALAKITALAKKTGVISSLDDISETFSQDSLKNRSKPTKDKHIQDLIFNNSVREIFLHYFMQIFTSYEAFVIQPSQDMESWLTNRDTMQNFDKAAFLSDQPETHLPFLAAFLESQMFTTLIDNKIISQWEDPDHNLKVFEMRLRTFREETRDQRVPRHPRHRHVRDAESVIEKRAGTTDLVATQPHEIEGILPINHRVGFFPTLQANILNMEPVTQRNKRDGMRWRKKDRLQQHSEHLQLQLSSDQKEKYIQEARSKGVRQPKLSDMNPAAMAQTNWKFVETLLKECKAKVTMMMDKEPQVSITSMDQVKRMLVEKMGQEAVELGHGESRVTGVEENTLIASLCDLLERIWSHGMQSKQGKSALWSHLLSYQEVEECQDSGKPIDPNLLTPDLSSVALESDVCPSGTQTWPIRRHKRKPSRGPELPVINPLPTSVLFDMRNVQQMRELKTHVGQARAWVRLSLEKKLLSRHLKELLHNTDLLRSLYKRYAFLRCQDETEQFLYHLLSLNAVDYYCFTNTFTNTVIPYRVMIFPRQKLSGGTTTATCWFSLSGQLGETTRVPIPKHSLDILIHNKNLGVLTTLRIGHDNGGMSPRWLVEHILARNEMTGHMYRFPCGRWLGKGVDDGSIERLLVAELVPPTTDATELMEKCRTPPRCRSPSMPRKSNEPKIEISDIQEMLGDAVNNLVKHFYKPEKERGSVTGLLCGEYGLVYCMEHVFQCGFKSARLFRDRLFIWDFLEKVQGHFENMITGSERGKLTEDNKATMFSFCHVVSKINASSQSVGKDGRFQLFICLGVRDHLLHRWIRVTSQCPVTHNMYEEKSFLRDPALVTFLIHILDSLKEFRIVLESSLTKGVHV